MSKRHALNGSLPRLAWFVDFEGFRAELSVLRREKEEGGKDKKDKGGRPPFYVVLMFKVCVLKFLYNLSDDNMELYNQAKPNTYSLCFHVIHPEQKFGVFGGSLNHTL